MERAKARRWRRPVRGRRHLRKVCVAQWEPNKRQHFHCIRISFYLRLNQTPGIRVVKAPRHSNCRKKGLSWYPSTLHSVRLKWLDADRGLFDISSRNKVTSRACKKKKSNFLLNSTIAPGDESRCQFKAWRRAGRPPASFSFVISKWEKDTVRQSEWASKWEHTIKNEREPGQNKKRPFSHFSSFRPDAA